MAEKIPDEVKTSITLEDNITDVCDEIKKSLKSVLDTYDEVNSKLSLGLNISNNINGNQTFYNNLYKVLNPSYADKLNNFSEFNRLRKEKNAEIERHADVAIKQADERLAQSFERMLHSAERIKQSAERINQETEKISLSRERIQQSAEKIKQADERLIQADERLRQADERLILKKKTNEINNNAKEEKLLQTIAKNNESIRAKSNKLALEKEKIKIDRLKSLQKKANEEMLLNIAERKLILRNNKALNKNTIYTTKNNLYAPVSNARKDLLEGIQNDIRYNKTTQYKDVYNILYSLSSIAKNIFNISNIKKAIDTSDTLSNIKSRINLLNESFNKKNGTNENTNSIMDYIYKSSQNSRMNYFDIMEKVADIGTYSGNVFNNQKEVIDFTNLLLKTLRTNGLSNKEALSVATQITTTMNRGILKGYELLSLFRNAPSIIEMVTETMKISEKQLEEMSRDRGITSRALKDVFFVNIEKINKNFEKIPITWEDITNNISNTIIKIFEPTLEKINKYANNKEFINNLDRTVVKTSIFISKISNMMLKFVDIIIKNWDIISSVLITILTISTASGFINFIIKFVESIKLIKGAISSLMLVFTNPYIAGISLATLSFILLGKAIVETSKTAKQASEINLTYYDVIMSVFTGYMYNIKKGLMALLGGIAGIGNMSIKIFSTIIDMSLAAYHSIYGLYLKVKSFLPFTSTTSSDANDELQKSVKSMKDFFDDFRLGKAFNEGVETVFDEEKWSRKFSDVVKDEILKRYNDKQSVSNQELSYKEYIDDIENYLNDMLDELKSANGTLEISEEDLKYMRDIAERDAINRFTTAEIKIDMTNNNNINNDMDIDGIVDALAGQIEEAMYVVAEGVH